MDKKEKEKHSSKWSSNQIINTAWNQLSIVNQLHCSIICSYIIGLFVVITVLNYHPYIHNDSTNGDDFKLSKLNNGTLAYCFELSRTHNFLTGCTKEKIVLGSQKKRTLQAWLSQYLWYQPYRVHKNSRVVQVLQDMPAQVIVPNIPLIHWNSALYLTKCSNVISFQSSKTSSESTF